MSEVIDIIEHKDHVIDALSELILLKKQGKIKAAFVSFTREDNTTRSCWVLPPGEFEKFNLLLDQMKNDILTYQREDRALTWEQEEL